ncbi:MAG TPA: hypothetical protein VLV50_00025 [Stellaceae bacterium]|nr:hypothetical protein [Stellaceae bacterium]
MTRHVSLAVIAALALLPASVRAAGIPCSDLPQAEKFVHEKLKPGPNTTEAERHLELAKSAKTELDCSNELSAVDAFARRSLAADRAAGQKTQP